MNATSTDFFSSGLLLTDGGLETHLIFDHGFDLPEAAAFLLLDDERGRATMRDYYCSCMDEAVRSGLGFVLESPTWRANPDWGTKVGFDTVALDRANRRAIDFIAELREEYGARLPITLLSGSIGPRGDAYTPGARMSADEAMAYHRAQIASFARAGADLVTAFTLPYGDEGLGIARAAAAEGIACVLGFTVETDGLLPSGEALQEVIARIDAQAGVRPRHYMINCAHPTHFASLFDGAPWTQRVRALRPNASSCSHAELDGSTTLDNGDPEDLARRTAELLRRLPAAAVVGGCCGTDPRHIGAIARQVGLQAVA